LPSASSLTARSALKDGQAFGMQSGRMIGSNPAFIKWASDMGRDKFGDSVFANPDVEKKPSTHGRKSSRAS
jgi:hypothetical protein